MKNNKKLLCMLILIANTNSSFSFFSFDKAFKEMQENINELHNSIEQMRQEEKNFFQKSEQKSSANPSLSIQDSHTDNAVIITIPNIYKANIDAHTTYDEQDNPINMTIKTDGHVIQIDYQAEYRYLTVTTTKQQQSEEITEKESSTQRFVFNQIIRQGTTLHNDIDLENASIEFNETQQILTISIPQIIHKQKTKSIPIAVVQ